MTETFYNGKQMALFIDCLNSGWNVKEVNIRMGKSCGQKWFMVEFSPEEHGWDNRFWDKLKELCQEREEEY